MDRIDPMVDVAFKMIFCEEDLLKNFLNSFLDFKINGLEISHQEPTKKENIEGKESFLDIKAITEDGKIINIEVQLRTQHFYTKRSLFYSSKLVTEDLKIKENYTEVPKVISINILDFVLFKKIPAFKTHFVQYECEHQFVLVDYPEIHFIEMPKISKYDLALNNEFHRWLLFLRPAKNENMYREVIKMDDNIKKAEERIQHIQQDPELKARYEARFKQLTDEANKLKTAKDEGKIEGRAEGRIEGESIGFEKAEQKYTKKLLALGWSLEKIEKEMGFDPKKYL